MSSCQEKPCNQQCSDCAYEIDDPNVIETVNGINQHIKAIQALILKNGTLCDLLFVGECLDILSKVPNSTECLRVNLSFVTDPDLRMS